MSSSPGQACKMLSSCSSQQRSICAPCTTQRIFAPPSPLSKSKRQINLGSSWQFRHSTRHSKRKNSDEPHRNFLTPWHKEIHRCQICYKLNRRFCFYKQNKAALQRRFSHIQDKQTAHDAVHKSTAFQNLSLCHFPIIAALSRSTQDKTTHCNLDSGHQHFSETASSSNK